MVFVDRKFMEGALTTQEGVACPSGGGSCRIIQAMSICHNLLEHNKLSILTSYNKGYVKYRICIYANGLRKTWQV